MSLTKTGCLILSCLLGMYAAVAVAAETYSITEAVENARPMHVQVQLRVTGQLQVPTAEEKTTSLKLAVKGKFDYHEKQLTGSGRDARTLRALRKYKQAVVEIDVAHQQTSLRLRPDLGFLIADGQRDGVEYYSLTTSLRNQELDLLKSPGDSLALLSLLPVQEVELDEEWSAPFWSGQMLTRMEALLKQKLVCRLKTVDNQIATVEFTGELEGATAGATTKINIEGNYQYDLAAKHITAATIIQTEKSDPGPISPGTNVTATVSFKRNAAEIISESFADYLEKNEVPLEPTAVQLLQHLDVTNSAMVLLDRDWHVFHQSDEMTVLRYLKDGSLIAQCNITAQSPLAANAIYSVAELENQVRKTLGTQMKSIKDSGSFDLRDGTKGYYCLADGSVDEMPMYWLYYQCVAADGRRALIAFTLETKLQKQFGNRAVRLMEQFRFRKPATK